MKTETKFLEMKIDNPTIKNIDSWIFGDKKKVYFRFECVDILYEKKQSFYQLQSNSMEVEEIIKNNCSGCACTCVNCIIFYDRSSDYKYSLGILIRLEYRLVQNKDFYTANTSLVDEENGRHIINAY